MKKTKILVLIAAITFGFSLKANAFPSDQTVLIIGNRAYDIYDGDDTSSTIISQRFSDSEFTNYVSNNYNNMYYVQSDSTGNTTIQDVFGGQSISEADLINRCGGKIDYYSGMSTVPMDYWVSENGQYKSSADSLSSSKNQYISLQITPKQVLGNLYLFNFKIDQLVGIPGAAFFSVGQSNKMGLTDSANCMIDTSSIDNGIPVYIYSSDMKTQIADATIKPEDIISNGNIINSFTIRTIKFNNVINPITAIASRYTVLGNMSNGGFLDSDNSYMYYVNTGDGNKIYKQNNYGTENYSICDDSAGYITVYGNWVYYCNYSDDGKIYKVKTDGTQRQKISDNKGTYLNVVDDRLYYVNGSDGGKIYSLDSAGNSRKLSDDQAAFLVLGTNNNLFYSNLTEGNSLYEIDTSGNRSKVDDLGKSNPAAYINISVNSPVAYYSSSDGKVYRSGDPYNPLQIRIQTKSGLVDDKISNINIANSTIYYKSLIDGGKLYKVGTNGGVGQRVVNDKVDAIFVYSPDSSTNTVYYVKNGKMYLVPVDNGNVSSNVKPIAISKPQVTNKISSIDAIPTIYTSFNDSSKTIDQINVLGYLPEKVSAIMKDGSIKQLPVSWDLVNPKAKNGVYTYNGIVVGYGNKITVSLAIATYDGLDPSAVTADNEIGKNDTIAIAPGSLSNGTVVKVYDPNNTAKVLKSATIDYTGGTVIGGLNFGLNSGTIKITVTKPGKAESPGINIPFGPERGNAPTISDWSFAATTLSNDGFTTTIKGIEIVLSSDEQFYVGNYTDSTKANNDTNDKWINVDNPGTYGSWNSDTDTLTLDSITVPTKDLQFGGGGKRIFIRKAGNPPSTPAVFMVNPRVPAPYGISFDETFGLIRGTTDKQEYSIDNGDNWNSCTNGTTNIGVFPNDKPVYVRIKATKSTLAGLETQQVKVTDSDGHNLNVAITDPADIADDGTIANNNNKITLKSSVPVTWRVVDLAGQSTNKASITPVDNQTAVLTGYENSVVNVIATTTDGNNLQGNLKVNITNQPVITVKNTTEFNNAISSGAKVIRLLGIGGSYYLNSLPMPTNSERNLTIIGQDQTSVLNVKTSNGNFAAVDGSNLVHLNLKNLTIKGASGSSVSSVIYADGGTVNLDGVYFDSLSSSSNDAIGVNQASSNATVTINNSRFLPSNSFKDAVVVSNGRVTNSSFTGNSNFTGETNAISASGNVVIQGNSFTNYAQSDECAIALSSGFDVNNVGGVQKDYWNIINNSSIGIYLPDGDSTSKDTIMKYNSIDIKNTITPIKTN